MDTETLKALIDGVEKLRKAGVSRFEVTKDAVKVEFGPPPDPALLAAHYCDLAARATGTGGVDLTDKVTPVTPIKEREPSETEDGEGAEESDGPQLTDEELELLHRDP
jgi:hypothetical protein